MVERNPSAGAIGDNVELLDREIRHLIRRHCGGVPRAVVIIDDAGREGRSGLDEKLVRAPIGGGGIEIEVRRVADGRNAIIARRVEILPQRRIAQVGLVEGDALLRVDADLFERIGRRGRKAYRDRQGNPYGKA